MIQCRWQLISPVAMPSNICYPVLQQLFSACLRCTAISHLIPGKSWHRLLKARSNWSNGDTVLIWSLFMQGLHLVQTMNTVGVTVPCSMPAAAILCLRPGSPGHMAAVVDLCPCFQPSVPLPLPLVPLPWVTDFTWDKVQGQTAIGAGLTTAHI